MGNVLVICLPTKHFGVRKNSFKHVHAFRSSWNLEVCFDISTTYAVVIFRVYFTTDAFNLIL